MGENVGDSWSVNHSVQHTTALVTRRVTTQQAGLCGRGVDTARQVTKGHPLQTDRAQKAALRSLSPGTTRGPGGRSWSHEAQNAPSPHRLGLLTTFRLLLEHPRCLSCRPTGPIRPCPGRA